MGWSLTYQNPPEPELMDEFLLSLGKALVLATLFEEKCRYILRLVKIVEGYKDSTESEDLDDILSSVDSLVKQLTLAKTIGSIMGPLKVTSSNVEVLRSAREARNYIAHEAGNLSPSSQSKTIFACQRQLRERLAPLVAGDNLVSAWVYEIEEKEPAPKRIQSEYLQRAISWVFGDGRELANEDV
jgi:hypothetical protein